MDFSHRNFFGNIRFYGAVRLILGCVFLWSGAVKLSHPSSFAAIIDAYGIVPEALLFFCAIFLGLLEITGGVGLLLDIRGSLAIISALLMLFIIILGYGIHMGLDVDCGCFGPEDPEARAFHGLRTALLRDFIMLTGAFYLYSWRYSRSFKPVRLKNLIIKGGEIVKRKIKFTITFAVLVIFTLAVATPTMAGLFGNKFEKEVEKEKGAIKLVREVKRGGYDVISTAELKKMIDDGKDIIIIDTMPYEARYKKAHIPGAKQFLFPIREMTEWDSKETGGKSQKDFAKLLGPDKNKTIIIYCGFVKCTRSHNGAAWAKKLGYKNVYRHPGGIFAWKGAKYPTESAEK